MIIVVTLILLLIVVPGLLYLVIFWYLKRHNFINEKEGCFTGFLNALGIINNGTKTNNYKVTEGRKYFKVVRENSVAAFVLKEDYKHFKKGDVLKAASWNAPALNRARGNVFKGLYPMQWTGPLYLNRSQF